MNNQKQHWNELHNQDRLKTYSHHPTSFAQEVINSFPPHAKILELGCGLGNDSYYFVQQGHAIIATDFADEALKQNTKKYKKIPNLQFAFLDISQIPYNFKDNEFDIVYARLSLHYFTDRITKEIIQEIHRVLKSGGLFCFLCKSIQDPLYGRGIKIEKDMYELNNHVRHFFSGEYAKQLLKNKFTIIKLKSGKEDFYGKKSSYIKVTTVKR